MFCLTRHVFCLTVCCRLSVWMSCSTSLDCQPRCDPVWACSAERLACADTCLETRLAARRQEVVTERSTSGHLAILASRAGQLSQVTGLLTIMVVSFSQAGLL